MLSWAPNVELGPQWCAAPPIFRHEPPPPPMFCLIFHFFFFVLYSSHSPRASSWPVQMVLNGVYLLLSLLSKNVAHLYVVHFAHAC